MASVSSLSKANTTFCLDLFKRLSDNDKSANVFYSPFSISSALAMVMLGARGNTATQMSEVLSFTEKKESQPPAGLEQMQQAVQFTLPPFLAKACLKTGSDEVHAEFNKLLGALHKTDAPYALSVANRLYGEMSYQFVQDFLNNTKTHYNAELETVDFINSYEAARASINTWVEKQTQGKIQNLLGQGAVDDLTRLVLVNAIYFKGNWDQKFDESITSDSKFRLNKNDTKPVKMMHQRSKFPMTYISEISCQVLEMPYKDKELSMLIFLPMDINDDSTGLEQLEKELTYENFAEWTKPEMMDNEKAEVSLPRFKMEEFYDLKSVLMSMGITEAFDQSLSNLSGISTESSLTVSKVVHKAYLDVNEEGTEAAAATGVVISTRTAVRTARFCADHPFIFFIRHNLSMSILFAGRYCSP